MKRFVNIAAAIFVSMAAVFPLAVVEANGPGEITWDVYNCKGVSDCPADTTGELEYAYSGAGTSSIFGGILSARIVCEGYGCPQTWNVYYEIEGTVSWEHNINFGARNFVITLGGTSTTSHTIPCGGGTAGGCNFHIYGMLDGSTLNPNPSVNYHVYSSVGMNPQPTGTTYSYSINVIYSGLPIGTDDCEDYLDDEEIASGTLDPTDEDGDLVELTTGQLYRATVSGGPWNDGTNDRYDAAVKEGEEAWRPVSDLLGAGEDYVECVQHDPDDENAISWVFEAQDADWRIRVNDLAGAFANNTGSLDYSITSVTTAAGLGDCGDQFLLNGTALATGTIDPTDPGGEIAFVTDISGHPRTGDWIAIVFTDGWQDDGAGDDLQTAAMKIGSGSWTSLTTHPNGLCVEETYGIGGALQSTTVYMQVTSDEDHSLRVDDDANWAANTGELDYSVYLARFSPVQTGCGINYNIGEYVGQRVVNADSEDGQDYDFDTLIEDSDWPISGSLETDYKIIAVVTSGIWSDGGTNSTEGGIRIEDMGGTENWVSLADYGNVLCVEQIDPVGHLRVYIEVHRSQPHLWFRAEDDDYGDNTGFLTFQFYQAHDNRLAPGPGGICSGYSTGEIIDTIVIPSNSPGIRLDGLDEGEYFAIVTSGGPWYDDGVESYDVAISQTTGIPLFDYELSDVAACTEQVDANHIRAYFYAQPGYDNWVSVADSSLDLGDNTGSITVIIYDAINSGNVWDTCGDAYILNQVPTDETRTVIPGNMEYGSELLYLDKRLTVGGTAITYAVEIRGTSGWGDGDVSDNYLAEICHQGVESECSWVPLSDAMDNGLASCVVMTDPEKETYRIYFTPSSGSYRLRVLDPDDNYLENSGRLIYDVYYANYQDPGVVDPDAPAVPGLPATWEFTCSTGCYRPTSLITTITVVFGDLGNVNLPVPDIGGWASYGVCTIVKFFTWCPYHTEAIRSAWIFFNENAEPFATLNKLTDFIEETSAMINGIEPYIQEGSRMSINESGGVGTLGNMNDPTDTDIVELPVVPFYLLYPDLDMNSNPWFGGSIDLTITPVEEDGSAKLEFLEICTENYGPYIGEGESNALCELHYLVTRTSFFVVLISVMDIVLILYVAFSYIPGYIKRWFKLLRGRTALLGEQ